MPLGGNIDASIGNKTAVRGASARVIAPARLHMGFLDLNGGLGRKFGSLGLAIDQPATELSLEYSRLDVVEGVECRRAERALERLKSLLGVEKNFRLTMNSAIPAHAGLGSGTQLALAVGAALAEIEGLKTQYRVLGEMQNRGARSAIGMAAFERGGFVVDGGRGPQDLAPPVVAQADIPTSWRMLLVLDPASVGVHGEVETSAFKTLPPMSRSISAEMCRVVLMQLLPALHEEDIEAFGAAVSKVQEYNGDYFASAQGGGKWSSSGVEKLVQRLAELGAVGIGQSSWGPTGFAFVKSAEVASQMRQQVLSEAKELGLTVIIARGRNQGASIELAHEATGDRLSPAAT